MYDYILTNRALGVNRLPVHEEWLHLGNHPSPHLQGPAVFLVPVTLTPVFHLQTKQTQRYITSNWLTYKRLNKSIDSTLSLIHI